MATTRPKYEAAQTDIEGYTRIKHTYIRMRDGIELCADLFLPFAASKDGQKVPLICSMGPYGKDIHASIFGLPKTPIYADMYTNIKPLGPDACFELCEPTIWCRDYGYALLRVDARGVGGSQGKLDPFGMERSLTIQADAEGQDLYDVVEWAAVQPWSTSKVAFSGISYFGMVGYWVAIMYQAIRRGGIYSNNFQSHWYNNIVVPSQGGNQDGVLAEEQLVANRVEYPSLCATTEYPTDGVWAVFDRVRKLSDIEVPFYSSGNWTDPELHLPGNIRAFNGISSKDKWLEMHTGNHLGAFYEPEHIELQKKFLDHYLFNKKDNGMLDVPRIRLVQHHGTETFYRENEVAYPPPDAKDVSFYFTPEKKLSLAKPSSAKTAFKYRGFRENIRFELDAAFSDSFEILGSPYLEIEVSTKAKDLDLFAYLRAHDSDGKPIVLAGNHGEPMDNFARGFFRLSHRDEVAKNFEKERVLSQPSVPKSEVVPNEVYTVIFPLYPAAYLFDEGQTLTMEIGSVNTQSTIPPMRHEGGDRVPERFEGDNVIFSHGRLVLPRVKR
ncbi:alpha/beta-hydrolase [Penicillium odoratum]|uniref:alpha/beta-hydrolase n=1 Tax=Penicillium odoratum TaxID=1167516 RepID=UPI002546884D|nr:alpha/beta-hydrolase [Penicillium odoratum]KAJ5777370.1 alpha/beta-hydrolase [Penicillium odoratum]